MQSKKEDKKLNKKQELFCKWYVTSGDTFGNAALSYAYSYGISVSDSRKYSGARKSGSRLLTNVDIVNKCNSLLRKTCSEDTVKIELGYLIRQRNDLAVKVSAIRLYNHLNRRLEAKSGSFKSGVVFM